MTTICFSTVVRAGDLGRAGEVVLLDWSSRTVLATLPLAPMQTSTQDNNPRGGRRGGRGIWVTPDYIYAATNDTIECLDHALTPQRVLSNGLLAGVHEVYMRSPGRLWVASTTIDAAVEVDLETGECTDSYWPREDARFQRALDLTPLDIDKTADNRLVFQSTRFTRDRSHLHLNAVASWRDELHALFSKHGVIVNLERGEVVMRHPLLVRAHDLVIVGQEVFVCSTGARQVCQFDLVSGQLIRTVDLKKLDGVPDLKMAKGSIRPGVSERIGIKLGRRPPVVAEPLFARGLQVVGDQVFVGVSPASILCIDWPRERLLDSFQYSDQVTTAVHGLVVDGSLKS